MRYGWSKNEKSSILPVRHWLRKLDGRRLIGAPPWVLPPPSSGGSSSPRSFLNLLLCKEDERELISQVNSSRARANYIDELLYTTSSMNQNSVKIVHPTMFDEWKPADHTWVSIFFWFAPKVIPVWVALIRTLLLRHSNLGFLLQNIQDEQHDYPYIKNFFFPFPNNYPLFGAKEPKMLQRTDYLV